ncbi:MAG TPA: DUF92 domain-containing protein, partial [Methanoregulaceae archaeon]|nr:DUF92 domain-containing protein [Methanoregulaceae archaeon]
PGTNGGVTLVGEVVACIAALIIGLVAFTVGIADPGLILVTLLAGFVGTNVDSIVGALFENRGLVGNSGTNLVATIGGGLFAMVFYLH